MSTYTQEKRRLSLDSPLGKDVLLLDSFEGTEQMSQLFSYELQLLSKKDSIDPKQIVGQRVTFSVDDFDDQPRYFNGFVSRFSAGGRNENDRLYEYVAEVVPWLWFLQRTSDCRIFQNKSVSDIIQKIFQDLGFTDFKLELQGNHPPHEYCVQYNETDFNFVSRLMEEEGIFYFFKHENGKHTLILADQKGAYQDCKDGQMEFGEQAEEREKPTNLTSWEHRYEFRSGKMAHTDYNFETPSLDLKAQTNSVVSIGDNSKFELYEFPGTYGKKNDGDALARVRMEEQEASYDTVISGGRARSHTPGAKFKIKKHVTKAEEGKGYVITSISHYGKAAPYQTGEEDEAAYHNEFVCIPDSVTFRPPRSTEKPRIHGVQPSIVTGPPGEEIWPDKYGRVKVQFYWDREGKKDDNSSCWIRVSQVHAGKGWGGIDIPRIGEEVLVAFIEGDPDRPIIVGRVYNAGCMPPFGLPGSKTSSGMKSDTHKGDGYNEIVLDDTAGKELIRIHGQYDMETTIEHDERVTIHHDRTETVDNNETITIGGNRTENVAKNETITILQNRTRTVAQNEVVTIGMTRTHTVAVNEAIAIGGMQEIAIGGTQALVIGAGQSLTVGGPKSETVGGKETVEVGGNQSVTVGGGQDVKVAKDVKETVGGGHSESVGKSLSITVGDDGSIQLGKKFSLVAGDEIVIKTGDASITMKKDGTIVIKGKDITVDGSGKITAKADGKMTMKGSQILQN